MRKITLIAKTLLFTCIVLSLNGCYLISSGMHNKPGYADISFPHFRYTDNKINFSIGPNIIKPFREEFLKAHNEHAELLSGIEAVRIRVFDAHQGRKHIERSIKKSIKNLKKEGWETVISVHDGQGRFALQTNESAGMINGVSVFAIGEEDAFFLNLMGEFNEQNLIAWSEKVKEMDSAERHKVFTTH